MRFKAAILTELGKPLVVDEVEAGELDVGQVLVRMMASGICGAQLGEISGAKGPDPWLPHLMGHEGGGVVVAVGPGVTKVSPGYHVVAHWRKGAGIEAAPPRYRWTGPLSTYHGGWVGGGWVTTFNQYAVISENRLTRIDNDVPFEVAALMGCAVTTALGLVNNEAKVKIGESVLVAGCGGVGLNIIQGAAIVGANPVVAFDRHDKSAEATLAGATGFTSTLDALGQFDVVVDCTGSPEVIIKGYDFMKPGGGRMVLVGQPDCSCDLSLPGFRRHYCGKTVMDSQGGLTDPSADIPRYVGLYKAGKLQLDWMITHHFSLDEVNDAIETVRSGEAIRCVIDMGDG